MALPEQPFIEGDPQARHSERIGRFILSVQASGGEYRRHYCSPQVTGLPINEYKAVEVGLLYAFEGFDNAGSDFIDPTRDARLVGFREHFSPNDCGIGAYMPIADVERLRKALIKRAKANKKPHRGQAVRRAPRYHY